VEADSGDSRDAAATFYRRRVVDNELDELLAGVAAVSLEGPKAVGKTATALRRAATVYRLDDEAERAIVEADPSRLLEGDRPVLIDKWQRFPASFDRVRRASTTARDPGAFCSPAQHRHQTRRRIPEPAGSSAYVCVR